MMHKEIEIKISLSPQQSEYLRMWLSANTKSLGIITITDHYLDNPNTTFYQRSANGYLEIPQFLRVRLTSQDNFVCYKKRHIDVTGKTESVDELETQISDGRKMIALFNNIGFTDQVIIKKQREIFLYNKFEIAIDTVSDLGTFVEIEVKKPSELVEEEKQKIYNLLEVIGIKKFISFDRGYLCMKLNPDHNFGQEVLL